MRSITLEQAALFAALAMALLTGYYLIDNSVLIGSAPTPVLSGSAVPSVLWAGFFLVVYRRASFIRAVTWITLVFAVILDAVVACLRFQQSVSYWTPFGNAQNIPGWLLRLGWAVFLVAFALAPKHAPGIRTRRIAVVLAIVSAPSALGTIFDAWNRWIGFLFGDFPRQAFWRVVITPAIQTLYWLSQILFLWTVWGNPELRDPAQASSARLAP